VGHPEMLRVEAYFDDEMDAVAAADIERHIEQCAECCCKISNRPARRSGGT
jgi:hypothetical protein